MSWDMVRLGDACDVNPSTKGKTTSLASDILVSFLPMEAMEAGTGKMNPIDKKLEAVKKGYTYFENGDVLFAKITPCMQNGKHAIARNLTNGIGFGSTEFHVLRPKQNVIAEWIYNFINQKGLLLAAENYFQGAVGQQRLPDDYLREVEIPLPPLDEQRRIAAEVEHQLAVVEKAKKLTEEQLELVLSAKSKSVETIFLSEFFANCEWIPIKDCSLKVGSGATPRGGQSAYHASGIPLIRSQNVHFNTFIVDGLAYINDKQNNELRNTVVMNGDVLLNITGASIGRVCVAPNEYCPANVNQHVCIIRLDKRFMPEFVSHYMATKEFQSNIMALQAGATRQALTKEQVQDFKMPMISKSQQELILAEIQDKGTTFNRLYEILCNQRDTINAMPAAILRHAFSGQM